MNIVASFDRRGERIVSGSSKGKVRVAWYIVMFLFTTAILLLLPDSHH